MQTFSGVVIAVMAFKRVMPFSQSMATYTRRMFSDPGWVMAFPSTMSHTFWVVTACRVVAIWRHSPFRDCSLLSYARITIRLHVMPCADGVKPSCQCWLAWIVATFMVTDVGRMVADGMRERTERSSLC